MPKETKITSHRQRVFCRGPSQRRKSPLRDPGPKNPEEKSAPSPRAISESWSILMDPDVTRQSSKFRVIGVHIWLAVPASTSLINSSDSNWPIFLRITSDTFLNGIPGLEIVVDIVPAASGMIQALATD